MPFQLPLPAVRVPPTTAVPEIVGAAVLAGGWGCPAEQRSVLPDAGTLGENSEVLPDVSVAVAVAEPVNESPDAHQVPSLAATTLPRKVAPSPLVSPEPGAAVNSSTVEPAGAVPFAELDDACAIVGESRPRFPTLVDVAPSLAFGPTAGCRSIPSPALPLIRFRVIVLRLVALVDPAGTSTTTPAAPEPVTVFASTRVSDAPAVT